MSKRISKAKQKSRFFLRCKQKYRVTVAIYANFVLNENAAKHLQLHLDPCQLLSRHMGSTPRKSTQ